MQFEKGKSQLPIGLDSKLQSSTETLPAIQVKNRVEWVNSDLELPFNLQTGKSTDLGFFLTNKIKSGEQSMGFEVKAHHGRSALFGRVIFGEKQGTGDKEERQLFRDIDIKGLGYSVFQITPARDEMLHSVGDVRIHDRNIKQSMGILNSRNAYKDKEFSEIFRRYGIRTHRVVAIIALEEIIYRGKRISILEAKNKKILAEDVEPVLEIRAFGTHARIIDVFNEDLMNPSTQSQKRADFFN